MESASRRELDPIAHTEFNTLHRSHTPSCTAMIDRYQDCIEGLEILSSPVYVTTYAKQNPIW